MRNSVTLVRETPDSAAGPARARGSPRWGALLVSLAIAVSCARADEPPRPGLHEPSEDDPGRIARVAPAPAREPGAQRAPGRQGVILGLALAGAALSVGGTQDSDTIEDIGDVLQIALPAGALGATFLSDDPEGRRRFLYSLGTSTLTVHTLKEALDKARPNASGLNSFPSGHTAAAFSGASFLYRRYGSRWGIPAFVLAAFTGASRVIAEKHFLDDVISGASISLFANRRFTVPLGELAVRPLATRGAVGLSLGLSHTPGRPPVRSSAERGSEKLRGFRYEWEFGGAAVDRNEVGGASSGAPVSFLLDETNNPTVTARIELGFAARERHEWAVQVAPFEVRETGRFETETAFAGVSVPSATELRSEYRLFDYRGRYRYRIVDRERWALDVGVGLSFQDLTSTIAWDAGIAEIEEGNFMPFGHLCAAVELSRSLALYFEVDGGTSGRDRLLDSALVVRYNLAPGWDLGGGVRRIERRIVTDRIRNEQDRDQGVVSLAYTF